jgi:hypothetical protein
MHTPRRLIFLLYRLSLVTVLSNFPIDLCLLCSVHNVIAPNPRSRLGQAFYPCFLSIQHSVIQYYVKPHSSSHRTEARLCLLL